MISSNTRFHFNTSNCSNKYSRSVAHFPRRHKPLQSLCTQELESRVKSRDSHQGLTIFPVHECTVLAPILFFFRLVQAGMHRLNGYVEFSFGCSGQRLWVCRVSYERGFYSGSHPPAKRENQLGTERISGKGIKPYLQVLDS